MYKRIFYPVILLVLTPLLSACNGFFEKDNTPEPTPLTHITPEIKPVRLWTARAGSSKGEEYLKLGPVVTPTTIFTTSTSGTITSTNKANGNRNWQVDTQLPLTTSPGVGDGLVVVASRQGDVAAYKQSNGALVWKTTVPGEILAAPAVSHGTVVVKAVDGYIRALSTQNGHKLWSFQQVEPSLILRGASAPIIQDNKIIAGFANGNLAKLSLNNGRVNWMRSIATPKGAFAIQRMIDIDANPVLFKHRVYAATYQGKIASLDWASGRVLWSHNISSYTGMVANSNHLYISDARGYVWAFDTNSGLVNWRQTKLEARLVTGPAIMGNYVVVGDAQGYLHWLDKQDGHFAARDYIGALYAAPIVQNNTLYALTINGYLVAYSLS